MSTTQAGQAEEVLEEANIRQLNRNVLSKLSKNPEPDVDYLRTLLQNVLRTTEEVRLENAHRAAACDALCGILRNGASSSNPSLRDLCTSPEVWMRALEMYFDRNNDARARPMKQILETLIRLLQEMHGHDPARSLSCVNHAVEKCIANLSDPNQPAYVRPAMFVLDNLLAKKLIKSADVVEAAVRRKAVESSPESFLDVEASVYRILLWAKNPDIAPVCGKLLTSFCRGARAHSESDESNEHGSPTTVWARPVRRLLDEFPGLIDVLEKDILPGLLRGDPSASMSFLQNLPFEALLHENTISVTETDLRLCLLLLRLNEELEIISFNDVFSDKWTVEQPSPGASSLSISEHICANMLRHSESDVRLVALTILTAPKLATRPLSQGVIVKLKERIWDFFDENDARIRNDFLSLMRRLFLKLEAVAVRLSKLESGSIAQHGRHVSNVWLEDAPDFRSLLVANVQFLGSYLTQLASFITPTASYQRHISALKTLTYIQKLDLPETTIEMIPELRSGTQLVRSLVDMLMDPFEDVRAMAASLLLSFSPEEVLLEGALKNAQILMRASGRADHADGYGRLVEVFELHKASNFARKMGTCEDLAIEDRARTYSRGTMTLLDEVDGLVAHARKDLERAVSDAPLHGKVIALRYLIASFDAVKLLAPLLSAAPTVERAQPSVDPELSGWTPDGQSPIVLRLHKTCEDIWKLVHPILCIDSPEGTNFLADEDEDAPDIGIKDTLSYAWRALKESSLLLREMMALAWKGPGIDTATMRGIGRSLFRQLAQLRHRGAFSAVAQTYAAFCVHCASAAIPETRELLVGLYEETLACIQAKSTALTRRSAGLPALIVGLLCAKPGHELTARVMEDLQRISQTPIGSGVTSELPQVHALNCLKDIFTNAKLGPVTEVYLSQVFTIAVSCLEKDLWAIRNSGLMLLKALLVRLEEGRVNSNTVYQQSRRGQFSKAAYAKHPGLADFVLKLLHEAKDDAESNATTQKQERLIEKTFPAIEVIERVGVPPEIEEDVRSLLLQHLGNPVWAMRSKAAACLALMLNEDGVIGEFERLGAPVSHPQSCITTNQLHGRMLLIRHALREGRIVAQFDRLAEILVSRIDEYLLQTASMSVHELYHENMINILKRGAKNDAATEYLQICGLDLNGGGESRSPISFGNNVSTDVAVVAQACIYATGLRDDSMIATDVVQLCLADGSEALAGGLTALRDLDKSPSTQDIRAIAKIDSSRLENLNGDVLASLLAYLSNTLLRWLTTAQREDMKAAAGQLQTFCDTLLRLRSNAAVSNALIVLWGAVTGIARRVEGSEVPTLDARNRPWYQMLRTAMDEQTDYDTREAAIDSILQFHAVAINDQIVDWSQYPLLPMLLVLYDGLADDDEDIRIKSAHSASLILASIEGHKSRSGTDLSPAAARQELLHFFQGSLSYTRKLADEALSRVLGYHLGSPPQASFASRFLRAEGKSTILFDEEKQNLFIDDYQEARSWTELALASTTGWSGIDEHIQWIEAGLKYVQARLATDDRSALQGPLGTFARPEIFLLLARLFLSAAVVLHNSQLYPQNGHLPKVAMVTGIRSTLVELQSASTNLDSPESMSEELRGILNMALEVSKAELPQES